VPENKASQSALRPLWSGTLSFGLVSIPVDVYSGTRAGGVGLRMLAPDGTPLARRYRCPEEKIDLEADQLARGYEHRPGEYVVVTDEELEALEPEKSRDIDLRLFVNADAIDPVYFERSFFLAPAGDSTKAYHLLVAVMQRAERVGVATFVMRDKEYLVAILAERGVLRAQTLRFHDEVRSIAGVGLPHKPRLSRAAVQAYEKLIEQHASDELDPEQLRNEAADRLLRLVHEKERRNEGIVKSDAAETGDQGAEVIDLMQILKRSLGKADSKRSATHALTKRKARSEKRASRRA
jgi:DNA end-binding protein Ku